jgi:hypothetical protein
MVFYIPRKDAEKRGRLVGEFKHRCCPVDPRHRFHLTFWGGWMSLDQRPIVCGRGESPDR